MNKKTSSIIQARMGSTRLPGKVMKKLGGKSVLGHVIERVKQSELIDEIIVATSTLNENDVIADEAKNHNVLYYRGSEENVLKRYYNSAKEYNTDIIVRITSDNPLTDPKIIDKVLKKYNSENYDLVTTSKPGKTTFPLGIGAEVFSFEALEKAYKKSTEKSQFEHVTPFMYQEDSIDVFLYEYEKDYSRYRLTLDEEEDFELLKRIYEHFYTGQYDFYMEDIIDFLKENPDLVKINQDITQKGYKHQ